MPVEPLISVLGNVFLKSYAEEALRNIGDRKGYLAIIRRKKRAALFPSKAKLEREKMKKIREKHGKKVGVALSPRTPAGAGSPGATSCRQARSATGPRTSAPGASPS